MELHIRHDIDAVRNEARNGRQRLIIRDCVIFIAAIIGVILGVNLYNDYDSYYYYESSLNWHYLLFPFVIISIADFVNQRTSRKNARVILKEEQHSESLPVAQLDSSHNCIVAGGFSPFIGAGFDITGWSFTVNLINPGDKTKEIKNVEIDELYAEIVSELEKLKIENCIIKDEIFIDGRDIRDDPQILPDGNYSKPIKKLPTSIVNGFKGNNDNKARHYKVVRIFLWEGQIVLTHLERV